MLGHGPDIYCRALSAERAFEYVNENFSNIPKRQVQECQLRCGIGSFRVGLAALLLPFVACHPGQYPSVSELSRHNFLVPLRFLAFQCLQRSNVSRDLH